MNNSMVLLGLVESVLNKGKHTSRGNYAFHCPFCHHHKPKLEINLEPNSKGENTWHCWTCDNKGKTVFSLFIAICYILEGLHIYLPAFIWMIC